MSSIYSCNSEAALQNYKNILKIDETYSLVFYCKVRSKDIGHYFVMDDKVFHELMTAINVPSSIVINPIL